ncbi:hypothetical protein lerEdw1_020465 [Lerista edwardsae]|nr:hypothetical protein lerEdw1_020465 [Lerista edwardsae]
MVWDFLQIVYKMEHVYVKDTDAEEEEEEEEEEETAAKDDYEDMATFLMCCSQLRNQLEFALREEKLILESLLQLGEEQLIPDWQVPMADKNVTNNITKLMDRIQRLEDLKGRVQELPKLIQFSVPKERRRPPSPVAPSQKDPKHLVEETIETMTNRMLEIVKVFERQTNKLHRVSNEQEVLEGKLQKIQQEYRTLAEEKEIMEDELQKMKASETTASVQTLENEKKMLEEMLRKALEDSEKAKVQLAEIPPTIPDWQFPITAIEDDKDASKRGKKATKSKGKGEDLTSGSGTDRALQRLQKADTGKAGETQKKKGVTLDTEKGLSEEAPPAESTSPTDKKEEQKKKAKGEGKAETAAKSKDKRRSVSKGPVSLPPIQQKQQLPVSPEEILPPDGKKTEIAISPQKLEDLSISEQTPTPESIQIMEGSSVTPGEAQGAVGEGTPTRLDMKASSVERRLPKMQIDSLGLGEEEIKGAIDERMRQLSDHLTALQGMPEAESLANLLLTPGKGMEELSDRQKLQLLNQLIAPGELQKAESLILKEGESADTMKEEEREKKRTLLGNVAATLQLLQQTESREAGQTEEEINEMAEMKRILLENLESNLMELQQTEVSGPSQHDVDMEIDGLTEKRSQLLLSLDLNMKNLQQAQAFAAAHPSEMSENKVKELLQQRELLVANLEENLQDLQSAKVLEASLAEKVKHDKEIKDLSQKSSILLANLESNLKELQEAQALEAIQPGSVSAEKIKELIEQRHLLTADLETNLQALQTAQAYTPGHAEEIILPEMKLHMLSEKKRVLQEKLDSNLKDLEELQTLASLEPDSLTEQKIQELTEERRLLNAELDTVVHDMQEAKRRASEIDEILKPSEKELFDLSVKKQLLLKNMESNLKELQEAQDLEAAEPGSVSEHKLQELTEQRRLLNVELDTIEHDMQEVKRRASEKGEILKTGEVELFELSAKKQLLLKDLESNLKELQEAQDLEASQPGSVSEHKLQELAEQRRHLNAELDTIVHDMKEATRRASEKGEILTPGEMELFELSAKKQILLKDLESNLKELQEAQDLAATQPGSVSEHKLQELAEQRRHLNAELDTVVYDMQEAKRRASEKGERLRPAERELHELSAKQQHLLKDLESNLKELQEAQDLEAAQPGSVSEHKLQELTEQRRQLNAKLDTVVHDMKEAKRRASEKGEILRPAEMELFELSDKKQRLLKNLESNLKELQEAQHLAAAEPGSVTEHKLQELTEQRRLLNANLDTVEHDMQEAKRRASVKGERLRPAERELHELSAKQQHLLKDLESNLKELQEAQDLAATQPGSVSEHKLQELTEQRRHLNAKLDTVAQDLQKAQRRASERGEILRPAEKEFLELSAKKQVLLKGLESNLKELQEAQDQAATEPGSVSETELLELSAKKELFLKDLESNSKEIQEAHDLAATEPGSVSEHKLQELTEQRRLLNAKLDTVEHDMQDAKRRVSVKGERLRPAEMELLELSEKQQDLLKDLESNLKELQEAQDLAATQPGSVSEHKLQELNEQRRHLNAKLDAVAHDLQKAQRRASERGEILRPAEMELFELSAKKELLLKDLESNLKELQEARALEATQPGSVSEHKLQELIEQRRHLNAKLDTIAHDMQEAKRRASEKVEILKPEEKEFLKLSAKKQLLLKDLESNLKELQEAQDQAAIEPGSVSEHKLQELTEQRRQLNAKLDTVVHDMQEAKRRASEKGEILKPGEMELCELSMKKQLLMKDLESNLNELEAAQDLAAAQPGSVSAHKLQELTDQRRHLNAKLDSIVHDMQKAKRRASERGEILRPGGVELFELTAKKQLLLKDLESNLKELEEAQELAAIQPGSVSEHKLQELAEQRERLTATLEATEEDIYETELWASRRAVSVKPHKMELYELFEKKEGLLKNLESNWNELQEAQELAATQPGSVSEHKLQELIEERRYLNAEVADTMHSIQEIQRRASEGRIFIRPSIRELYELSEKKQLLLEDMESNWKELQEVQALAVTQPGSVSEHKLQELAERREHLTADLEATVYNIQKAQNRAAKGPGILRPAERELYELSEKKELLLENLESNRLELEEAQALEAIKPGSISEHKIQELTKQRQRLTMDLEATVKDMKKAQHRDIERPITVRPVVRELYELTEKKQLLLGSLESNERELREAQTLAATEPSSVSEHRLQVLAEQRRRLIAELDATVNNIQKAQSRVLESSVIIHPAERELYELSEKKQLLLENLKELQEAQAAAATHPGSVSEERLKELALQRRRLTDDLEATVRDIKKAQGRPTAVTASPSEMELYELSEKKQLLLEKLEINRKELQAAQDYAALHPVSVAAQSKVEQLLEQRKRLTLDIEATAHEIQESLRRSSEKALIKRSERKLKDLSAKKQLLLENVVSNLKDFEEAYAAAVSEPDGISDKVTQVLNEQAKILSANLAIIVQDIKEIKARVAQIGGMKIFIERDINKLYSKKKIFLDYLETNLKNLQEAQVRFGSHPSNSNEQRILELTEQRKLLTNALEAITQDIEDARDLAPDKGRLVKSEEKVLEELSYQKNVILKKLASNLKDLKEAQAFAAEHPGAIAEEKVKELTEQRLLLAADLEAIEQNMKKALGSVSEQVGVLKLRELGDVSEKRTLDLENIESSMEDLKDLQAFVASHPDNINEQNNLIEKQKILAINIEKFLQDIREKESADLEPVLKMRPDVRKINDLLLLSRLESKLNELQHIGLLPDTLLNRLKRKVRKLRKQKKGLIDRWEIPLQDELLAATKLEEYGLTQEEIEELLGRKRNLFSYVQSSIRELQQQGIISQGSLTEKEIDDLSGEKRALEEYLVAVPLELLEAEQEAVSTKYGIDAQQKAKQKALAAKLEANMREFQSALELKLKAAQIDVSEIPTTQKVSESLYLQPMKSVTSGLQLQITKAPAIKKIKPEHVSFIAKQDTDMSSYLTQQDRLIKKEIELALKRQLLHQAPSGKISLPVLGTPASLDASVHKLPGKYRINILVNVGSFDSVSE